MSGENIEFNRTKDEEYWLPCGKCNGKTCHNVVVSVDVSGGDPSGYYDYNETYQVVQCQGCKMHSFRKNEINSEDCVEDEESGETVYLNHEELYPSRVAGRHKLSQAHFLPHAVARIYNETHAALCSKQPILAGIGIRALIETVCKEKSAKGRDLEKKIDDLVSLGVLTNDGAEILHGLRILGNVSAHEVQLQSEDTLGIAMDVVEHLLKGVYILPAVAAKLPKRKVPAQP
jgi:Domain of unknown function (DUF4145)